MKILTAKGTNFGSYPSVEFKYDDLGLALISGPTKAGKSTLLDLVCWILYGTTSKDLNADDVKSWPGDLRTEGEAAVLLPGRLLHITRVRGCRPTENDLFFSINDGDVIRGKDATDTQKLINQELGVDADLYIAASYIHQFTNDKFFTAKAKDRKETMERIADLSLPIKLGTKASDTRKKENLKLEGLLKDKARLGGKLETLNESIEKNTIQAAVWDAEHAESLAKVQLSLDNYTKNKEERVYKLVDQLTELDKMIQTPDVFDKRFKQIKEQLVTLQSIEKEFELKNEALISEKANLKVLQSELKKLTSNTHDQCPTCLGPSNNPNKSARVKELNETAALLERDINNLVSTVSNLVNAIALKPKLQDSYQKCTEEKAKNERLIDKFETVQAQAISLREETNPYEAQLSELQLQVNPFLKTHASYSHAKDEVLDQLSALDSEVVRTEEQVSALTWLYNKSSELRGILLQRVVKQINDTTNSILERHFDATIRVNFVMVDSDKLDIEVYNEGYDCKYAQLSGGERAMLKLAFGVGYMKAAENRAGIKFHTLMLDEAFNGLDSSLKVKAYGLLQSLEKDYSSIIVIDHSEELKQMFPTTFEVKKLGAHSSITAAV